MIDVSTIPLVDPDGDLQNVPAATSVTQVLGTPSPTTPFVLVVDDSPDMRGLIAEVLTAEGYDVVPVGSAPRALEVMAERTPDLVILDLLMPGMSGFALRGLMLRHEVLARVPVVVLSAYWQRPSETLDVAEVLSKPINLDRLIEVAARITGFAGRRASARPDGGDGRSTPAG